MNEIDWLTDRRPELPDPDRDTTMAARDALLRHAERRPDAPGPTRAAATAPHRPAHPRSRRRGHSRLSRALVGAAAVAAAVLVSVGVLPSGDGSDGPIGSLATAEAAPLMQLAAQLRTQPQPGRGDATLVVRRTTADGRVVVVYDLLRDDGRYAFGRSRAELRSAANGPGSDGGRLARILAAVSAAARLPAEEARARLLTADRVQIDRIPADSAARRRAVVDNAVWGLSVDALQLGAGDPQVRAGVMRLLATLPDVRIEDRGATLEIANDTETLTVDGATGVLLRLTSRRPDVAADVPPPVVDYTVRRVVAADLR
jgi:hypothetical protein